MLLGQNVSLRRLGANRATEVKFGRFLSNEKVKLNELIDEGTKMASADCAGLHVLAIQDTTELNFKAHANKVSGLGPVGCSKDIGFFLHPLLALDASSGSCLGLSDVYAWIREPLEEDEKQKSKKNSHDYRRLPLEEKESHRWLTVASNGKNRLKQSAHLTICGDRESDIYECWSRLPDARTDLLIRASRDRCLTNGELLYSYGDSLAEKGRIVVSVRSRPGKRSAHDAQLAVRYASVEIKRPQRHSDNVDPPSIKLNYIDVKEVASSIIGEEWPIHWRLLTTHEVNSLDDALQMVKWYSYRWQIEQLFRTLKKQGLQFEKSQLTTSKGLLKLSVIALRVATKTMQLTLSREGGEADRNVDTVFTKKEIDVLRVIVPSLEGKTVKQKNPYPEGKLSWAAWAIARLGGWKGYTSERPPGPITMLRGQQEFAAFCRGWFMAKDLCIP